MTKKRIVLVIALLIAFLAISIGIYYFTKDEAMTVTGLVIAKGDNYVILEANEADYLVTDIQNDYEIGDELTITYLKSSLNNQSNPLTITAQTEKKVANKQNNDDQPEDNPDPDDTTLDNQTNDLEETTPNTDTSSNKPANNSGNNEATNQNTNTLTPDEAVLDYVNSLEEDVNNGLTANLKQGFITVVDFLFYDGEIAGHTLSELSNKAKLEVLKVALWLDSKIDSLFPGYKETISAKYAEVKTLVVSTYLDLTSKICKSNAELCLSAKEDFQDLKASFGLTWEFLKELASSSLDKLSSWYEIWSGK